MIRLLLIGVLLFWPAMVSAETWYEWMQENGVMAYSNQEVPAKFDGTYVTHGPEYMKDYTLKNYSKYTEVKCYAYTNDVDRSCDALRKSERSER